ncbi:hypothetical protein QJS66_11770 [Kocuria rhizophila]|nr:hypothetical protein QJS66_11770 [Kocuria rhizophila]
MPRRRDDDAARRPPRAPLIPARLHHTYDGSMTPHPRGDHPCAPRTAPRVSAPGPHRGAPGRDPAGAAVRPRVRGRVLPAVWRSRTRWRRATWRAVCWRSAWPCSPWCGRGWATRGSPPRRHRRLAAAGCPPVIAEWPGW